jgi:hypothetical protein
MTEDVSAPSDTRSHDVDPEALREDVDAIKSAMGLAERYDGAPSTWLYIAALVAVGAAISQAIHTARLSGWLHWAAWIGLFGVVGPMGDRVLFGSRRAGWPSGPHTPNIPLQFGAVYFAVVPLQILLAPFLEVDGYVATGSLVLGMVLVLLGVAYVVIGASMRAYRIRLRDRVPFYLGGVWIVGLGTAIPHVDVLQEWGFAAFGGCYLAYALLVYGVLVGGDGA